MRGTHDNPKYITYFYTLGGMGWAGFMIDNVK